MSYDRKDALHQRAKREGFRSRAAYKLAEIQRDKKLLRRGQRVADLGCWPGGWLQVAAGAVGPTGRVVGIDQAAIDPPLELPQVTCLVGDLSEPSAAEVLREALGGPADVLLSDAAPKTTGIKATDRAREEALLEAIAALVPGLLSPGGDLLMKLLDCPEAQRITGELRPQFERAGGIGVKASRKGSKERYFLARGYRP